jgi:23S rRNA (uracil1939-C5)-methyltransferase
VDEVVIERLARTGDGVAGPVRVPFALPGERLRGAVVGGAMPAPELVAASPHRVPPPCPYFGACGGCALQHASDGYVAGWKRKVVVATLAARGIAAEVRPVVTSPPRSRRRAVLAGRRTRKGALVGFHERRSEQVIDVLDCAVLRPEILAAKPALAELVHLGAPRGGALRLTVTSGPAGLDVDAAGGKPLDASLRAALAEVAASADLARLAWDGEPLAQLRPPFQAFGPARVIPPPGAFLQPTAEGEAALAAAVRGAVGDARRIADLFAGCGTFALPLAAAAEVHAADADGAMLAGLAAGWRQAPGLKRVATAARDLYRRPLLARELDRFEAAVLDPPRAGAEAQTAELARSRVARIAAVSCNPASFARDARVLLDAGFRLDWVQPVDQFRWSPHVELAARFSR